MITAPHKHSLDPPRRQTNRQESKRDRKQVHRILPGEEQHHPSRIAHCISHLASLGLIKWAPHSRAAAKGNNNKWWSSGTSCVAFKRTSKAQKRGAANTPIVGRQQKAHTATHTHTYANVLGSWTPTADVREGAGRRIADVWERKQQEEDNSSNSAYNNSNRQTQLR